MIAEASSLDGSDPLREARAYNNCIMMMLTMPYILFGIIGYKVYRGFKAQEAARQKASGGDA